MYTVAKGEKRKLALALPLQPKLPACHPPLESGATPACRQVPATNWCVAPGTWALKDQAIAVRSYGTQQTASYTRMGRLGS